MENRKKWISIGAAILALLVTVAFFLPLFFNYQSKLTNNTNINPNAQAFFSNRDINEKEGIKFNIVEKIDNELLLQNLTNYTTYAKPNEIQFDEQQIKQNITSLLKTEILKRQKFLSEKNLYLQVRYALSDKLNLLLDLRWTDKISCTTFYFDRVKLNISTIKQNS